MPRYLFLFLFFCIEVNSAFAQKLWSIRSEQQILKKVKSCSTNDKISKFQTWELNLNRLSKIAVKSPSKGNGKVSSVIITLPCADGVIRHFMLYDSNTMSAESAKQFPGIKSYVGECVEDKLITARIDKNDLGLHVLINNSKGEIFMIEPYCKATTKYYCSYLKSDYKTDREPFHEGR